MAMSQKDPTEVPAETVWFLKQENVRRILGGLFVACGCFVVLDVVFWLTGFDKHPHLKWEEWPGFHAVFGFVACVVLVLISRFVLRPLVMREEDYYDKNSMEKGEENDA